MISLRNLLLDSSQHGTGGAKFYLNEGQFFGTNGAVQEIRIAANAGRLAVFGTSLHHASPGGVR